MKWNEENTHQSYFLSLQGNSGGVFDSFENFLGLMRIFILVVLFFQKFERMGESYYFLNEQS